MFEYHLCEWNQRERIWGRAREDAKIEEVVSREKMGKGICSKGEEEGLEIENSGLVKMNAVSLTKFMDSRSWNGLMSHTCSKIIVHRSTVFHYVSCPDDVPSIFLVIILKDRTVDDSLRKSMRCCEAQMCRHSVMFQIGDFQSIAEALPYIAP